MANDDSDITILHLLTFDFLATTRKYTLHQMCPCLALFHHPSLFETVWVCVCAYDQCVIIRMSNMAAVASDFHFRSFFRIEDFLNEVFKLWQPKNTCSSRIANNIYIYCIGAQPKTLMEALTLPQIIWPFFIRFRFISCRFSCRSNFTIQHSPHWMQARSKIREILRVCLRPNLKFIWIYVLSRSLKNFQFELGWLRTWEKSIYQFDFHISVFFQMKRDGQEFLWQ